jgi:hypothetical protein
MPKDERWPVHVFKPPVWNPKVLLCPSDLNPAEEHSYIINDNIKLKQIRLGDGDLAGLSSSEFIIMAEKKTEVPDYYSVAGPLIQHAGETDLIEGYRHGRVGSCYLFMDWHAEPLVRNAADRGMDPWDVPAP